MLLTASVVITTRNRKQELGQALRSVVTQTTEADILVIDDGSSDGTAQMVSSEFPQARLVRHERSRGYIARRNEGACLAKGKVIFSIDDDAVFSSRRVISQTLMDFSDERIGAVAIPYIDVRKDAIPRQIAPDKNSVWVTNAFVGTAHALRRDTFVRLGGYAEHLIHQGEEGEFCIRMLDAGCFVRLGNADPIHHLESPRRDFRRMDFFGRRNDILFAWHNVPKSCLPLHLLATTVNGTRCGIRCRRLKTMVWGLLCGYGACLRYWGHRRPVSRAAYRVFRQLKNAGAIKFDALADYFQPPKTAERSMNRTGIRTDTNQQGCDTPEARQSLPCAPIWGKPPR